MHTTEQLDVWDKALKHIASEVETKVFEQWFSQTTCRFENDFAVIYAQSDLGKQIIQSNYSQLLRSALNSAGLPDIQIEILAISQPSQPTQYETFVEFSHPSEETSIDTDSSSENHISHLNRNYTFDNFVIGESNRFAYTNATSLASESAGNGASLFIYGKSGLGKTHLMHAVGNAYLAKNPGAKIMCVTCDQFINSLIESITRKTQNAFKDLYRSVDLLLVDDIQMLVKSESIQLEMFNIFNNLYDCGKKIIFTSDRPPKELSALMERLRSRLAWGLTVDIQTPELETRVAILRQKAEKLNFQLANDIAMFIAESVESNVRELEGALNRLIAYSQNNMADNLTEAREILLPILREGVTQKKIDPDVIMEIVSSHFEITLSDLTGSSRMKKIAVPRQIAQHLIRELTASPFPKIAEKFGGRDHTTVMYACRKIANEMETDENFKSTVQHIINKVRERAL